MTDYNHARIIELAEGPAVPGSKTHFLIKQAMELMLPKDKRSRIWELLNVRAYREAAIVLMEEALPGWDWEKYSGNMVVLREPIDTVHWKAHDYAGDVQDDLARAFLIAVLQAHREVSA